MKNKSRKYFSKFDKKKNTPKEKILLVAKSIC